MKLKRIVLTTVIMLFCFLLFIELSRLLTKDEIDDVTPGISCEPELMQKTDMLWIIPIFNNISIANNTDWCNEIKSLNKQVELHGVHHTYQEFLYPRSQEYLQSGIDAFEQCLGKKPTMFKPPQMAYTKDNDEILKNANIVRRNDIDQIVRKVYHCNDTGKFPNWLIKII